MDCNCDGTTQAAPLQQLIAQHPAALGVAGLGALLVLVGLAWRLRLAPRVLVALGLYSRLTKEKLGENRHRRALADIISNGPGVETADLIKRIGLDGGTAEYHLQVLEREGVVKSLHVGRTRTWYSAGTPAPTPAQQALRDPTRALILDIVTREPGITMTRLARMTGKSKAATHAHIHTLLGARVLEARREGIRRRLRASSEDPSEARSSIQPAASP